MGWRWAQREEGACCGLEVGTGQRPSMETAATGAGTQGKHLLSPSRGRCGSAEAS